MLSSNVCVQISPLREAPLTVGTFELVMFYVIDNDNYLKFLLLTTSLNYKIKTNVHKVCKDSLRISVKRREDIVTICSTYYLATTEQDQYK